MFSDIAVGLKCCGYDGAWNVIVTGAFRGEEVDVLTGL